MLAGCDVPPEVAENAQRRSDALWDAWNRCIAQGGVPIQDDWVGVPAMKRCEGVSNEQ